MRIKYIGILTFVFGLLLLTQSVLAAPGDSKVLFDSKDTVFNIGSGTAHVTSDVYQYTSGTWAGHYEYNYQIFNTDSDVGITVFSVSMPDGITVDAYGYATYAGSSGSPMFWGSINTISQVQPGPGPVLWQTKLQSAEAIFGTAILNNSPFSDSSPLLTIYSDYGPALSQGALFGMPVGTAEYAHAVGDLFAPVPEPATVVLLTIGGILTARTRRRRAA